MTLTIRGYEGTPPPPVLFRGGWDIDTAYAPGHVVQSATSLYQAVADTTGDDPGTDDGSHWFRVYEGA